MRSGVLAGLCVAVLVLCVYLPQPCEAQYEAIVVALFKKISSMWRNDSVNFMGHTCRVSIKPTINKFKLYWKGKFWCPGWAPFNGKSRRKSRSGAVEHATKDFVGKALRSGLITEEDAKVWLKG